MGERWKVKDETKDHGGAGKDRLEKHQYHMSGKKKPGRAPAKGGQWARESEREKAPRRKARHKTRRTTGQQAAAGKRSGSRAGQWDGRDT